MINFNEVRQHQYITINGVPQERDIINYAVSCPHCGTHLVEFQPGPSKTDIIREVFTDDYISSHKFCSVCGQKLDYPLIIDTDAVVKEESEGELTNDGQC